MSKIINTFILIIIVSFAFSQDKDDILLELTINTDTVCPGEPVLITANISNGMPPYILKDADDNLLSPPYFINPKESFELIVSVVDINNQRTTGSIKINVFPKPEISIKSDINSGCQPLTVKFNDETSNSIPRTYNWIFGDHGISSNKSPSYTYSENGDFTVSLRVTEQHTNKACISIDTLTKPISVYKKPVSKFIVRNEVANQIKSEIYFNNISINDNNSMWTFGDEDTSLFRSTYHTFDTIGTYKVKLIATSEYGCKDTSSKYVKIIENFSFFAPEAFTPDGDGINDEFEFQHSGIVDEGYRFKVYDRFGHIVFNTDNKNKTWNGDIYGNKLAQSGTYVYIVTYKSYLLTEYTKSGTIIIIR